MNIAGVRTGIKNALASVYGLHVYDYEADNPAPPAAVVRMPETINPTFVFGGSKWNYLIGVQLLVARGSDRGADADLEQFLDQSGDTSVVAALIADRTFGGACETSTITEIRDFGLVTVVDVPAITCTILIETTT